MEEEKECRNVGRGEKQGWTAHKRENNTETTTG